MHDRGLEIGKQMLGNMKGNGHTNEGHGGDGERGRRQGG